MSNLRELEVRSICVMDVLKVLSCITQDLIIEAIYAGIIQAKLDQKNSRVCGFLRSQYKL